MPPFTRSEDMEVWRQARVLCGEIYRVFDKGSFVKDFRLRDQIRRASVSIMSNSAEGFNKSGTGEFIQIFATAKGSVDEKRSRLYFAFDQGCLDREEFAWFSISASDTTMIIAGLMSYLRTSGVKGTKYKSSQT